MLASPIHKFVLLMNPKTATTSYNKSVVGRCAHIRVGRNEFFKHLTYAAYRDMFGDYFDRKGCDVFIVVREPLDVLRSWYRFRINRNRYKYKLDKTAFDHELNDLNRFGAKGKPWVHDNIDKNVSGTERFRVNREETSTRSITFQDFMDDWAQETPTRRANVSCGIDFCLDAQGNIPDEVIFIRYTELSKLTERLCSNLGVHFDLPHLNPSPKVDPELMTLEDEHKYEKLNEARHIYSRIPFV